VTQAFLELCDLQLDDIKSDVFKLLERFVVILYDRTSDQDNFNSCRKHLFAKRSCTLELLPPTSDASMMHVERAVYKAVFIWGQCLATTPKIYNPCLWGWTNTADKCIVYLDD